MLLRNGSNFDHPHGGGAASYHGDIRDSENGNGFYPQVTSSAAYRHLSCRSHGHAPPSRSPMPYTSPSPAPYAGHPQRGKAYVNLQGGGFDLEAGVPEDGHSNLSSSSVGNRYSNYPQVIPKEQAYPAVYPPGYNIDSYDDAGRTGYYDSQPQSYSHPNEDDFAASNLILSPAYSEKGDNRPGFDATLKQLANQSSQEKESAKNRSISSNLDANIQSGDIDQANEKLSTIREEIDADQVVADIDGLLL